MASFEDELNQQNAMLEEYPSANPTRKELIVRTLSIRAHIGENLPKAGKVPAPPPCTAHTG